MPSLLSSRIKKVSDDLAQKAEQYAAVNSNPQAIVQQVMQIGGKAMISRRFTLAEGERVAAMMIAAIALARGDVETPQGM